MATRNRYTTRWIVGGAIALALVGAGVGIVAANGDDDTAEEADIEGAVTGSDRERAAAAAMDHVGGGSIVEVEAGDDGAAFGVEIRLADGAQVEVMLDGGFTVIGSERDDE